MGIYITTLIHFGKKKSKSYSLITAIDNIVESIAVPCAWTEG